jgi:choline dehydrogenase-like flavoprotein
MSGESFDVVIVGSGPTGSAYARVIADARPDASILLVEAGPIVADPPGLHMANIVDAAKRRAAQVASQGPNQHPYVHPTTADESFPTLDERAAALADRPGLFRVGSGDVFGADYPVAQEASNVGGMGSHWFGACPRPSEFERIPFIERSVLDAAYDGAESLLRVTNSEFSGSAFATHVERVVGDMVNADRTEDRRVQTMPMAVRMTPNGVHRSGPNVILGDLLDGAHAGFELRPNTVCKRVVLDDGRAIGVELVDRKSGSSSIVAAAWVVVAADALRTPQVLYASGVRPAALGRHLNEHPQVSVMAEVRGLAPGTGARDAEGDTSTMADPAAVSVASSGVTWIPYAGDDYPFHGMLDQIDPTSLPGAAESGDLTPVISVHLFLPQEPQWDNRVEFSDEESDWIGMPAMRIHNRFSDRDRDVLRRAEAEVLRLSQGLGGVVEGDEPWILPGGSSLHYQGTVRMGPADDGTCVADPTSRVWGTPNLFVAGNGLIPTTTACNPTLTSVALAILGANEILASLD